MQVVSFTEARRRLKSVIDRVASDSDVTIITRRDADDAVVMSLDHYSSLMETVHLLGVPANAAHLAESIKQHREGRIVKRALLEDGRSPRPKSA
ncbi:MAG: type II toxin-antitoxin system prevent-host-death family antitoxin [Gammaproteobacteria bacterium]|nr:type II toxin-antitoxin system prevent-host-death family antitoxin [Gammaproteobacteria bacterium]